MKETPIQILAQGRYIHRKEQKDKTAYCYMDQQGTVWYVSLEYKARARVSEKHDFATKPEMWEEHFIPPVKKAMKLKELIAELNKLNPELEVWLNDDVVAFPIKESPFYTSFIKQEEDGYIEADEGTEVVLMDVEVVYKNV